MILSKEANILNKQGNTGCQCSDYITCILASVEYDGLPVANMKEGCEKLIEVCRKKYRTENQLLKYQSLKS